MKLISLIYLYKLVKNYFLGPFKIFFASLVFSAFSLSTIIPIYITYISYSFVVLSGFFCVWKFRSPLDYSSLLFFIVFCVVALLRPEADISALVNAFFCLLFIILLTSICKSFSLRPMIHFAKMVNSYDHILILFASVIALLGLASLLGIVQFDTRSGFHSLEKSSINYFSSFSRLTSIYREPSGLGKPLFIPFVIALMTGYTWVSLLLLMTLFLTFSPHNYLFAIIASFPFLISNSLIVKPLALANSLFKVRKLITLFIFVGSLSYLVFEYWHIIYDYLSLRFFSARTLADDGRVVLFSDGIVHSLPSLNLSYFLGNGIGSLSNYNEHSTFHIPIFDLFYEVGLIGLVAFIGLLNSSFIFLINGSVLNLPTQRLLLYLFFLDTTVLIFSPYRTPYSAIFLYFFFRLALFNNLNGTSSFALNNRRGKVS